MKFTKSITASTVLIVLTIAGLTGCGPDDPEAYRDIVVPDSVMPSAPVTGDPTVVVDDDSGVESEVDSGTLVGVDAEIGDTFDHPVFVNKPGQGVYGMTDGTWVITDSTKELTPDIIADLKTRAATIPNLDGIEDPDAKAVALRSWSDDLRARWSAATTHSIPLIVWAQQGRLRADDKELSTVWYAIVPVSGTEGAGDKVFTDTTPEGVEEQVNQWGDANGHTISELITLTQ